MIEVNRLNCRLRRRRGKFDSTDAESAARAGLNGEATGVPKTGDGNIEALRALRTTRIVMVPLTWDPTPRPTATGAEPRAEAIAKSCDASTLRDTRNLPVPHELTAVPLGTDLRTTRNDARNSLTRNCLTTLGASDSACQICFRGNNPNASVGSAPRPRCHQ